MKKSIADLMVYTERLSETINYFNHNNDKDGDWRDFFYRDPSFLLAKIVSTNVNDYFEKYKRIKEYLNHLDEPADWVQYYSQRCIISLASWPKLLMNGIIHFRIHPGMKKLRLSCVTRCRLVKIPDQESTIA